MQYHFPHRMRYSSALYLCLLCSYLSQQHKQCHTVSATNPSQVSSEDHVPRPPEGSGDIAADATAATAAVWNKLRRDIADEDEKEHEDRSANEEISIASPMNRAKTSQQQQKQQQGAKEKGKTQDGEEEPPVAVEEEPLTPALFQLHTKHPDKFMQNITDGRRMPVWPFPPMLQMHLPPKWLSEVFFDVLRALSLTGSIIIPAQTIQQGVFTMTTQKVAVPHLFSKLGEQYEPRFEIDQRHIRMILLDMNLQFNTYMTISARPQESIWRPAWESLFVCSGELEVSVIGLAMHVKMRVDPPFNVVLEEVDWNIRDLVVKQLTQRMFSMELLWSIGISSAWWLKRRLRADPESGDLHQIMSVPRQIKNKAIFFNEHQLPALGQTISASISQLLRPLFPYQDKLISHVFPQLMVLRGRLVLLVHYLTSSPDGPLPFGLSKKDLVYVSATDETSGPDGSSKPPPPMTSDGAPLVTHGLWALQDFIISLYQTIIKESILKDADAALKI